MNTAILCCETLKQELALVFEQTGCDYPIYWIESGLHNHPPRLTSKLQERVDELQAYDRIILGFGFCGNSLLGVKSGRSELVFPRVDDCISLFIGSARKRAALSAVNPTYFMTKGWLDGERNLWVEYQYAIDKYGPETGRLIFDSMLCHYKTLGILDTGGYPLEEVMPMSEKIADTLGLELQIQEASVDYLRELITGPWPESKFVRIPPGGVIGAQDLLVPEE